MTSRHSLSVLRVSLVAAIGCIGLVFPAFIGAQTLDLPHPDVIDAARLVTPTIETEVWPTPEQLVSAGTAKVGPTGVPVSVDLRNVPTTPNPEFENSGRRVHLQGSLDRFEPRANGPTDGTAPVRDGEPTLLGSDHVDGLMFDSPDASPGTFVSGFDARNDSGWYPPDTEMAVGPEYIVEAVNSGFMVYTKTGTLTRSYTSFSGFVNLPSPWAGFCYDPRVVYSNEHGKFLMMIMGKDETNLKSYVWLMVSQTSDPNGNWWLYRIDLSSGGSGDEVWLDYASIGVDHWGVYITGNYFAFPGSTGAGRTALWSFDPAIMSGGGYSSYVWGNVSWPGGGRAFTVQPALPHTQNSSGNSFLVATYPGSGSQICLFTQYGKRYPSDPNPTAAGLSGTAIDCKQYYAMYNNVDQPGSGWDIDGGDSRVMNAVYSQGKVYATLTLNWDGNRVYSEVYIAALDVGGTLAWDRPIWNSNYNFFYPAITVEGTSSTPDVYLALSHTQPGSASGFASAASVIAVDGGSSTVYTENLGNAAYSKWDGDFEGDGRNRWGDYSGAGWDWSCNAAWGAAEHAVAGNDWDTQITARTLGSYDPCQYFHVSTPNGGETLYAGNTLSINWEKMNIPAGDDIKVVLWDGSAWIHLSGSLASTATSYSWDIPNTPATGARIFVGSNTPGSSTWNASDQSDGTFTIVGRPDLTNAAFLPPAAASAGGTFDVLNQVRNDGVVASGAFTVELRLSTNTICSTSDPLVGSWSSGGLSPGALVSNVTSVTIPPWALSGTQYLCMLVDSPGVVTEFDETNNVVYQAMAITNTTIFWDTFESGDVSAWTSSVP